MESDVPTSFISELSLFPECAARSGCVWPVWPVLKGLVSAGRDSRPLELVPLEPRPPDLASCPQGPAHPGGLLPLKHRPLAAGRPWGHRGGGTSPGWALGSESAPGSGPTAPHACSQGSSCGGEHRALRGGSLGQQRPDPGVAPPQPRPGCGDSQAQGGVS